MSPEPAAAKGLVVSDGVVCCVVGAEQYALRARDIQGVARAERMQHEDAPDGRAGTIRHDGRAVPVYRLTDLLDRPQSSADDRHVVVTRQGRSLVGLLVDRIVRLPLTERARVLPLPSIVGPVPAARFEGLLTLDDTSCLVLAPHAFDRATPVHPATPVQPALLRSGLGRGADAPVAVTFSSAAFPRASVDRYALDARRVAALVQSLPRVALPGSPAHVKALGWWRDTTIPIVNFSNGLADDAPGGSERHLITRAGDTGCSALVAFTVNADVTLHRATKDDRRLPDDCEPFIRGIFLIGTERVGLLDLESLLSGTLTGHATRSL